MLDDDLDFKAAPESPPGISIPDRPGNDFLAEGVLIEIIADLPLHQSRFGGYFRDLPAMKKWGEEVRAGERTFRFVGDPQIYNIDGPVEGGRTSASGMAAPEREPPAIRENLVSDRTEPNGFPWLPVGAALLILVTGMGFFFHSRGTTG